MSSSSSSQAMVSGGGGVISPPSTVQPPLPSSGSSSASSSIGQLGGGDVYMTPVSVATTGATGAASDGDSGEEIGPLSRDRCNTWPMRRPQPDGNAQTSPLIHEQIPEEDGE